LKSDDIIKYHDSKTISVGMTLEEEFNLDEPLFTIAEVAEKLKVSDHTVRSWIQKRWLRIIKVGRGVRIPSSAITEFVERSMRYQG